MKTFRLVLLSASLLTILFSYNVFASCPCDPDDPHGSKSSLISKDCPSCPDDTKDIYFLLSKDCPSCPDDPEDGLIA